MNHAQCQQLVSVYVDGELDDAHAASMFEHLGACHQCRQFWSSSMQIRTAIISEMPAETPPSLDRRVLGGLHTEAKRPLTSNPFASFWWTRISIPLPAAASLAFLILFLSLLFSPVLVPIQTKAASVSTEETIKVPPEIRQRIGLY